MGHTGRLPTWEKKTFQQNINNAASSRYTTRKETRSVVITIDGTLLSAHGKIICMNILGKMS